MYTSYMATVSTTKFLTFVAFFLHLAILSDIRRGLATILNYDNCMNAIVY